jgi:putative MATE family efflux protein
MHDFTRGSIPRHLLATSGFMLVTMAFQTLYFLVDLFWVGRLGKEAVAAVGIAGNLMFVVLAITQMLGVGTTTLVSHAAGQKDHARALLVFNQSQALSMVAGGLFFLLAMFLRGVYVRGMSPDAETARLAARYLTWFVPALTLQFGMVAMASALRGSGNFKPGMIVQTATVVLNMVLAPFLIFGWVTHRPMGVAGAALATFIAIVIGTIWFLTYFLPRDAYLRITSHGWKPQLALWWKMLQIGLPAGAEFALMGVFLFIVYSVSRPFGSGAQAGFGIGMRVIQAGFMPVIALGFAVAPVAGQNFGARHADRVRETFRSAVLLSLGLMLVLALCATSPRRRWSASSRRTRRSSRRARTTCASSPGTSSRPAWCSSPRACSRRWATRGPRCSVRSCGSSSWRCRRSCSRGCPASNCAGSGTCRLRPSRCRWS